VTKHPTTTLGVYESENLHNICPTENAHYVGPIWTIVVLISLGFFECLVNLKIYKLWNIEKDT